MLTAEYTYSGGNMQTLTEQVQTPLSLKQKTFSGFFIAFTALLTPKEVVT